MAKGTDETTKKYWQEMLVDIQIKIKGQNITLENNDIQTLNEKTNIAIGTLNGYFGLDKSKMPANYPNADTRNLLAKEVLGFADWNEYVKSKKIETVKIEIVEPLIILNMENLEVFKTQLKNLLQDGKYAKLFEIVDKMIEEGVLVGNARTEYAKFKKQFKKGVNKQDEDYDERITVWINDLKK